MQTNTSPNNDSMSNDETTPRRNQINDNDAAEETLARNDQELRDASNVSSSSKPARRRRRLAHRRQYAKSRRLASSYLRSQFVRYDSLTNKYEPEDSWFRVQTFDDNNAVGLAASAINDNIVGSERIPVQQQPDDFYSDWTKFGDLSSAGLDQQQQRGPYFPDNPAGPDHDSYFVSYSSSSLDSCSLIDNSHDNSSLASQELHKSDRSKSPLLAAASAKSLTYLPNLSKLDNDNKGAATGQMIATTSSSSNKPATYEKLLHYKLRKQQLHGSSDLFHENNHMDPSRRENDKQSKYQQIKFSTDRFVRSETIDLNKWHQSSSDQSPKSKFFPTASSSKQFSYSQRAKEMLKSSNKTCSTAGPKANVPTSERFVSLHNLVYSSSDSSTTQSFIRQSNSARLDSQEVSEVNSIIMLKMPSRLAILSRSFLFHVSRSVRALILTLFPTRTYSSVSIMFTSMTYSMVQSMIPHPSP